MNKQEYESLNKGDKLKIVSLDYTNIGDANIEIGEVVEFVGHLTGSSSKNDLFINRGEESWSMSHKDLEIIEGETEYKVGDEVVFIRYSDETKWENMYGWFIGDKFRISSTCAYDDYLRIENEENKSFYVNPCQIKMYHSDEKLETVDLTVSVLTNLPTNQSTELEHTEKTPVKSDGGSSSYYFTKLPQHMIDKIVETGGIEIKDITRYVYDNDSDCKDITKALKRIQEWKKGGGKQGIDALYDANKIIFFAEELRESIKNDFGDKLNK